MLPKKGCWGTTSEGKKFFPLNMQLDSISIESIAHSLANQCRFYGHVREFYSIAQHSVLVSELAIGQTNEQTLWFLLHDAPEAYIGDILGPLKKNIYAVISQSPDKLVFEHIDKVEDDILNIITIALGIQGPFPDWDMLKKADRVLFATEVRDLMPRVDDEEWLASLPISSLPTIIPLPPKEAKKLFLDRYYELGGK